jgi:hypothetical protein
MGPDTLYEHAFIGEAGAHAEGTLVTFGSVPPALLVGRGRVFYERYIERFGGEPECYAASAYDATGAGPLKYREQITAEQIAVVDAHVAVPTGSGLGIEVDEDALRHLDVRTRRSLL